MNRRRVLKIGLATGAAVTVLAPLGIFWLTEKCEFSSLNLITRASWGALPPNLDASGEHGLFDPISNREGWLVYPEPLSEHLNTIVVHHSALPLSDGALEIQQIHLKIRGFADIGYHFLIDERGQFYEGRSIGVRGAHTGGHNTGTIGISLLGNFEVTEPTEAQLTTLKAVIRCLTALYHITHLAGHRDFQPDETVCPGSHLAALLPELAADLGLEFGTGGYAAPQF